jgi:hypothetical protein
MFGDLGTGHPVGVYVKEARGGGDSSSLFANVINRVFSDRPSRKLRRRPMTKRAACGRPRVTSVGADGVPATARSSAEPKSPQGVAEKLKGYERRSQALAFLRDANAE